VCKRIKKNIKGCEVERRRRLAGIISAKVRERSLWGGHTREVRLAGLFSTVFIARDGGSLLRRGQVVRYVEEKERRGAGGVVENCGRTVGDGIGKWRGVGKGNQGRW